MQGRLGTPTPHGVFFGAAMKELRKTAKAKIMLKVGPIMDSEILTDRGPASKPQKFVLQKPKIQKSMALTTAKTIIFNKYGF